jgi:uncharacterized DUF497 family protein
VTFDPAKRTVTLQERGLDFADAATLFDYGEARFITAGLINGRFVVLVWTPREGTRRVISMRYGHADEEQRWRDRMG